MLHGIQCACVTDELSNFLTNGGGDFSSPLFFLLHVRNVCDSMVVMIYAMSVKGGEFMNSQECLIKLRKSTGMSRKEFCAYFEIPNRTMPEYLLRLMAYKVEMEKLAEKNKDKRG